MKLYLAGPDVFLPDADAIGDAKRARIAAAGGIALWPLDTVLETDPETHPKPLVARAIFDANRALIEQADALLANLTPFRGPSADPGTVWELGFAYALGKPIFGYSNVAADFATRTRAFLARSADEMAVEDLELPSDNLMIHFGLAGFFAVEAADIWRDLAAFEQALAAALAHFSDRGG